MAAALPFQCSFCERSFSDKNFVFRHRKINHPRLRFEETHQCHEHCREVFYFQHDLERHQQECRVMALVRKEEEEDAELQDNLPVVQEGNNNEDKEDGHDAGNDADDEADEPEAVPMLEQMEPQAAGPRSLGHYVNKAMARVKDVGSKCISGKKKPGV